MPRTTLTTCARGTASLEAVIVLPLFLVVWLGILHMCKLQHGVLMARAQARSCAWRYSNAGCRDGAPAGCSGMASSQTELQAADESELSIDGVLSNIQPFDVLFEQVLGSSARVRVARTVKPTVQMSEEEVEVGASVYVLCNERNRTLGEIAKDTACALVPSGTFVGATMGCGGDREWDVK